MADWPSSNFKKSRFSPDSLKKLRKFYSKRFAGTDLHHPFPVSRIPRPEAAANRMTVFPYDERAHAAYHVLFWNLRIDQVWDMLERIHQHIFETRQDYTNQWWIKECDLESGDFVQRKDFQHRRTDRLNQMIEAKHLRNAWLRAFGGEDISTAENLLKIMMLFIIFGPKIVDKRQIFHNGNLADFFGKGQIDNRILWAFQTLFGEGGSVQGIKSKIAGILNKNKFYSLRIL